MVWLVFNVMIALMLMEFGVFGALEKTLALYGHVAVAWIAAITADLVINKPLGLSPPGIEFRRAYLYDINPVGVGATFGATAVSLLAFLGVFGPSVAAFSSFIAFGIATCLVPAIAIATGGRYYLARTPEPVVEGGERTCLICRHAFDPEDMAPCPFHAGEICSLCCSLESNCGDLCKPHGAVVRQAEAFGKAHLPPRLAEFARSRYGMFTAVTSVFMVVIGAILLMIRQQSVLASPQSADVIDWSFTLAFGLLVIVVGVAAWLHTLAHESRILATAERERQTSRLLAEIRAHERTDAALQRAKEVAEAANEAKSRYVVAISHELRTPLNAILGYAQLLENDPTLPEHRRPGVRVIRRSSEHLADLIEGLLDISKIEAGRLEVYREETALREMLDQMAAIFRMEAAEKGIGFVFDVARSVPERVHADQRRLRQILMNLLSNAVRYTTRGEIRFRIAYRNDIATFTVEDTGRGIPAEEQGRIFLPFERIVDPAAPVRGTGLGLTITRLLTDILGGDLRLESEAGVGTRFTVRLMLPRIGGAVPTEGRQRIYGYKGRRQRILVVDDDEAHRTILADTLRPLGFEVILAESGEMALAMVHAGVPDLCLVDVAMPGMSGWTLAAVLRRERRLSAPIVMVSAHAADARTAPATVSYNDDFMAKPVNLDHLLSRIERHLRVEWLTEEPKPAPALRPAASVRDMEALEAMVAIGHIRGIEQAIDAIDISRPGHAVFATTARRLVANLDLEGLSEFLVETRRGI